MGELRDKNGRFVSGHEDITAEQKIKKAASLREAWKKRPDYIGDIKDKEPRVYSSWRSIMFTKKGKAAGCCEEWKNFRKFYEDVIASYEKGKVLRRKDTSKMWSPNNFLWVTQEEANDIRGGLVYLEYQGENLTLKQWSDKTSQPLNAIKIRYYRHRDSYTTEEIIYGRKIKRHSKTPKDISESDNERAKASKMLSSYRCRDKKKGLEICDMDIDYMLNNIIRKPCVYCGDTRRVGADRIDSSKGHTKDNVVPCCVECNQVKGDMFSYEEMLVLGKTIREIKEKRFI